MPGQEWFQNFFVDGKYAEVLAAIPEERTEREVSFIVEALGLDQGSRVLDLCCGVGRHSIALGQRGYAVTGIDLDEAALGIAKARASEAGVSVRFNVSDMLGITFFNEFDAVISIFSSWAYYPTDEEDAQVLRLIERALKPGAVFLLDIMNRERVIRTYRDNEWAKQEEGTVVLTRREFDLASSRMKETQIVLGTDGPRSEKWFTFRHYTLTEFIRMLRNAGLIYRQAWGGFDASPYTIESQRMIVLAQKEAS
jgi:SAM-dependent methyltransferase